MHSVTLGIIWHIFLRSIWHVGAHFNPTDHKAFVADALEKTA
jgi:hypothetical protein